MSLIVQDLGLSRRACDRCHGQKLRCKREKNNQGCLRCQRAGVQCTSRSLRSRRQAPPYATQAASSELTHAAPSFGKPRQIKMHVPENDLKPQIANPDTEQNNIEVPEEFGLSPKSLVDLPSDLDLDLDLSSLQSEIGHPFDAHFQPDMDFATMPSHYSMEPFDQEQSQARMGQNEKQNPVELASASHSTSHQGSRMLPSSKTDMMPSYSEALSNHSRCQSSLGKTMTPKSLENQSRDEINAHPTVFDQQEMGTALSTYCENGGTDSRHGQITSRRPRSIQCDIQSSYNRGKQTTKPIVDPVLASWIRKLSNLSVELHLHMLSIPPVEVESCTWADSSGKKPNSTQLNQEIPVDSTIQLSNQYTEILHDVLSQSKTRQAHTGSTTAVGALDQSSQLLILSSYLCLAESYHKIVQHIKTWTEVRLEMGGSTSVEQFPVQLPSLAIGSFKLSTSSSSRPLVLTCIIEAMIMQIRDLISEMMKPSHSHNGTTQASNSPSDEPGTSKDDGLGIVAKGTLQAIRAKEHSIMTLIQRVCRLALQCGSP